VRQRKASDPLVGVVRITPVIPKHASLCILPFPQIFQPRMHVDWDEMAGESTAHLTKTYPPVSPWFLKGTM
jgi:hypothetical protein